MIIVQKKKLSNVNTRKQDYKIILNSLDNPNQIQTHSSLDYQLLYPKQEI